MCLLTISKISSKAGLSVKGWDCLYAEFYGMSCQIDNSRFSLLFYEMVHMFHMIKIITSS